MTDDSDVNSNSDSNGYTAPRLGTVVLTDETPTDGSALTYELTFEREYPHPSDVIWRSITDPELTKLWWAESRIDLRVGGEFGLRWLNGEDGNPQEWSSGRVLALEPGRLLELSNESHGFIGWRLRPAGTGTHVTFVNRVTPPQRRYVTMSLGGWHVHLDHLAFVLDGGAIDWTRWYPDYEPAWKAIHEKYQETTGLP